MSTSSLFCPPPVGQSPSVLGEDPYRDDPWGLNPPVIQREYTGLCKSYPHIPCMASPDCLNSPPCITHPTTCTPTCLQFNDPAFEQIYSGK